jgi:predicted glycogen debranching enzyme
LRRDSEEGKDSVLILVNNDVERPQTVVLAAAALPDPGKLKFDLSGQALPKMTVSKGGALEFKLEAGGCYCLSASANAQGLTGEEYRRARAQAAWALTALGRLLPIEKIPAFDWHELARMVDKNPAAFLAACSHADPKIVRDNLESLLTSPGTNENYPPVVIWNLLDRRRILPVPVNHWLLVQDSAPFRATLNGDGDDTFQHVQSIQVRDGFVACFAPRPTAAEARLQVERYALAVGTVEGPIRFLGAGPDLDLGGMAPLSISNLAAPLGPASDARAKEIEARSTAIREQSLVLLTNGLGGMARLGVDFGAIKSKYDCLLAANLHPTLPVDRHVFVKRARVWVNADGFLTPLDLRNLASFEPGPPAVWYFIASAGDGRTVEIQVTASMLPGRNTTVLHFDRPATNQVNDKPLPDDCEVRLTVRLDIEDRNFHTQTKRNGGADYHFSTNSRPLAGRIGFSFTPAADRHFSAWTGAGFYHHQAEWSENIPHPVEQSRGQEGSGDAYSPGWFDLPMTRGAGVSLVICADATDPSEVEIHNSRVSPATILPGTTPVFAESDVFGRQLLRVAEAFVVRRDGGITVIAGYPWFLDWGRDSLICARGLLAAGMIEQVKQLLVIFGRFEKDGTLPNTIHGEDASNRDTSDAPLWYGIVCEEAAALAGDELYKTKVNGEKSIADVLRNIALGCINGTPNGIHIDTRSGLVWSPSHFTWMDTNYPACTPREGYPVEIQVLWIRLLRQLERIGPKTEGKRWRELAGQAELSLQKYFWLEDRGYFADLLAAGPGQPAAPAVVDDSLRSNYLLVVSLGLVTGETARRCVAAAARYLVVPGALRSLAPLPVSPPLPIYDNQGRLLNNPSEPYFGRYEGDEDTRRKPAYHNGTAWTWTFPVFCEALARAWDCSPEAIAAAKSYLGGMDRLMMGACLGQIPEILDGDAPHAQRGCDAQAWGVTEALRVWKFLQDPKKTAIA